MLLIKLHIYTKMYSSYLKFGLIMIYSKQKKYYFFFTHVAFIVLLTIFIILPNVTFSKTSNSTFWINTAIKKSFPVRFNHSDKAHNSLGFQHNFEYNNLNSKISLSSNNEKKIILDQSFVQFKKNDKIFGIGKVNRNWSFSPITSLILSSNARPTSSIYFILDTEQKTNNPLTSWAGPVTFEIFNSLHSDTTKVDNAMLLGLRAIIEPTQNLKFELVKTSQWGGDGQPRNLSSFFTAFAGDSNTGKNSNINQLAGFGLSYNVKIAGVSSRLYAQFIGEDEAGNLPSCFMTLVGNELEFPGNFLFSKLGFEIIDTRIDTTTHNFCGPNTAYNNNTYSYTNFGETLGTSIDTEGKSFHMWISKKISNKVDIHFSIKDVTINDANWFDHRLNSYKTNGLQLNTGTSIKLNLIKFKTNLSYQNFSLDKMDYKNGLNLHLNIEHTF